MEKKEKRVATERREWGVGEGVIIEHFQDHLYNTETA